MAERLNFQESQYAFAAHIRNPDKHARPADVEERRMAIYRDLFFNNVSSFLAGTFPVIKKILSQARWDQLIREFMVKHQAHTPLFLEMPQEFIAFLQHEYEPTADDYGFLVELAHYEWVELAVSVDPANIDLSEVDVRGNLMAGVPVVSPLAWSLSYQYPVHTIRPDNLPSEPSPHGTYLVVYRSHEDKVGFLEINVVTARLLEILKQSPDNSGHSLMMQIAQEMNHPQPEVVINGGSETLQQLWRHDIILGTAKQ
ncbi:MAG: putative DNA-binding domain-containing protein [Pseudomonadota bacterium]